MLERFDLVGKRKQRVNTLSGGMKRRVLFARALMHDPEVLFLDEPTAGVDIELRYRLWEYIRELKPRRADDPAHHALPGGSRGVV